MGDAAQRENICRVRRGPMPVLGDTQLKGATGDEGLVNNVCEAMGVDYHEQGQIWQRDRPKWFWNE